MLRRRPCHAPVSASQKLTEGTEVVRTYKRMVLVSAAERQRHQCDDNSTNLDKLWDVSTVALVVRWLIFSFVLDQQMCLQTVNCIRLSPDWVHTQSILQSSTFSMLIFSGFSSLHTVQPLRTLPEPVCIMYIYTQGELRLVHAEFFFSHANWICLVLCQSRRHWALSKT